jgi:preprotein translocase subunit SecG
MEILILSFHVLVGIAVCGLVLLQHGKGADMGAAFGSGSAGSLFGASGSANFLSRATAVLATVFFITSLVLTYLGTHRSESKGVIDSAKDAKVEKKVTSTPPAPPATGAPPAVPQPPVDGGSKAGDVPK